MGCSDFPSPRFLLLPLICLDKDSHLKSLPVRFFILFDYLYIVRIKGAMKSEHNYFGLLIYVSTVQIYLLISRNYC